MRSDPQRYYDLLTIDPGLRGTGVAAFQVGRLAAAWLLCSRANGDLAIEEIFASADKTIFLSAYDDIVVELPQTYGGRGAGRTDANVLIRLGALAGTLVGGAIRTAKYRTRMRFVAPNEWKSNVDPDIVLGRIWALLDDKEKEIVRAASGKRAKGWDHNVLDAVGIGLHQVGRMERGGRKVFADAEV
jgi:hypothetical protein